MSDLHLRCNDILNDESIDEDDRFEQVEDLVRAEFPNKSSSDLERMVLDLLWRHREGTLAQSEPKLVVTQKKPVASVVTQSADAPLPSDPRKMEKLPPASPAPLRVKPQGHQEEEETEKPEEDDQENWGQDSMSPFDMIRSILGAETTDQDIKTALERYDFDITKTLAFFTGGAEQPVSEEQEEESDSYSFYSSPGVDPSTIMCKYFSQYGECFRADCRYSHDLSTRVCKYWIQGNCLAGESCPFLHEIPMDSLSLDEQQEQQDPTPPPAPVPLTEDEFPALGAAKSSKKKPKPSPFKFNPASAFKFNPESAFKPGVTPAAAAVTPPHRSVAPAAAQAPQRAAPQKKIVVNRSRIDIPRPKHIPWVDTEYGRNAQYVSHRNSAAKHGDMRNKYLQLAADNWRKNNPAQASKFSEKGQNHNTQMVEEYELGASILSEQSQWAESEYFLDLHGMSLNDAVEKLDTTLKTVERDENDSPRPVYVICSIGHHYLRNPKSEDKLTQSVKQFASKQGYELKDFGNDSKFGRVLGIDPWSHFDITIKHSS